MYGSVEAKQLIDWFEFLQLVGVNTVLMYPYKLNYQARKVINYYRDLGFVETSEGFDFPEKGLH